MSVECVLCNEGYTADSNGDHFALGFVWPCANVKTKGKRLSPIEKLQQENTLLRAALKLTRLDLLAAVKEIDRELEEN